HVEDGTITLIGATTENPSFEINAALLSRTRIIRLERLDHSDLESLIRMAIKDPVRGLGDSLRLSDDAIRSLAETSEGDARRTLTTLENISLSIPPSHREISREQVEEA